MPSFRRKPESRLIYWIPAFTDMTAFCLYRALAGITARACVDLENKKAANAARADDLALAAFVSRPQAEAQIGAKRNKSYTTDYMVSTGEARCKLKFRPGRGWLFPRLYPAHVECAQHPSARWPSAKNPLCRHPP